jgi:hypothetical protein
VTTSTDVLGIATAHMDEGPGTFTAWYGLPGTPWCAEFVSFCLYTGGFRDDAGHMSLPGTTTAKGWSFCPSMEKAARDAGWWSSEPAEGAAVLYDWGNPPGEAAHVGLVESIDAAGVHTIEGNSPDRVGGENDPEVARHLIGPGGDRGATTVRGYIHWPYDGAPRSTGAAAPWPGRVLAVTTPLMTGADVQTWQQRMVERGWALAADGQYGPQSEGVCKGFQQEKGLLVDGQVGPVTWTTAWTAPVV